MTSPFPDELISAYLDGELTDQERVRVEQQLRTDAGLRRMCDELRVLRSTLRSIPTEDPSEDLAERVLRQAERRMLLGGEKADDEDPIPPPAAAPDVRPVTASTPARRNWRLVAGVVASAAALLLVAVVLFNPSGVAPETSEVAIRVDSNTSGSAAAAPEPLAKEGDVALEVEPKNDGLGNALDALRTEEESGSQDARLLQESETGRDAYDAPRDAPADELMMRRKPEQGANARGVGDAYFHSAPSTKPALRSMDKPDRAAPKSSASSSSDTRRKGAGLGARDGDRSGIGASPLGDIDSGSVMGGMRGASPGKSQFGVGGGKVKSSKQLQDSERTPERFSIAAPGEMDLATQDDRSRTDASRADIVHRLIRQLDRNQNLLVKVSMPRDLETRFRQSGVSQHGKLNRRGEAADKLPGTAGRESGVAKAAAAPVAEQLQLKADRHLDDVILVEGTPEEVRKSLERLVRQSDVQVHTTSTLTRRDLARLSLLGSTASEYSEPRPGSRTHDFIAPRQSETLNEGVQIAKDEAVESEEMAATPESPRAVIQILFRFKTTSAEKQ